MVVENEREAAWGDYFTEETKRAHQDLVEGYEWNLVQDRYARPERRFLRVHEC